MGARAADGQKVWADQWGSERNDSARGVTVNGGSAYVAGYVGVPNSVAAPGGCGEGPNPDWGCMAFLRKYDSAGDLVWSRQFGTCCYTGAYGVAANDVGVFVIALGDMFVYRFGFDGNLVWSKPPPADATPSSYLHLGIAASNDSIYLAGGNMLWKYDLNGGLVWSSRVIVQGLSNVLTVQCLETSSSSVFLAGYGGLSNSTYRDYSFVARYDPQGNQTWARIFNGLASESNAESVTTVQSTVFVGGLGFGFSSPPFDRLEAVGYLTSFDINGTQMWTRYFASIEYLNGLASDSTGAYFAGKGNLNSTRYPYGILAGKYDFTGNELWTRQLTSSWSDHVDSIALDTDGVYYAGSVWNSSITDNNGAGGVDAFVIRETKNVSSETKIYWRCSGGGQGDRIACSASVFGGVPPFNITWSFGDGSHGTGPTVQHTYNWPGDYPISVTVEDGNGTISTHSIQRNIAFQLLSPPNIPFLVTGLVGTLMVLSVFQLMRRSRKLSEETKGNDRPTRGERTESSRFLPWLD